MITKSRAKRKPVVDPYDRDDKRRRVSAGTRAAFADCASVEDYEILFFLNGGTYGNVFKVQDKITGEILAMKEELKGLTPETKTEVDILKSLPSHPYVVAFKNVAGDSEDGVYILMEYLDTDLNKYLSSKKQPLEEGEVKMFMKQLLVGVEFLHRHGVMHRDLKPANVLMRTEGGGEPSIRICDFGQSTRFKENVVALYSPRLGTQWYRAPELLLGDEEELYSTEVDMWSLGCIMGELILKKVLFRGGSEEADQLRVIHRILGLPNSEVLIRSSISSRLSEAGFDLLMGLLCYDISKRLTARAALNHPWFQEDS